MLLLEPNRTDYDLSWRMFGVWVRVHPMFWLLSAVMGWSAVDLGLEYLLVWIACVFVSVLIHELGHVFMGRIFGTDGHIVLYGFGGLAIGSNSLASHWKRIAVSFAGPLAGFLYLGVLVLGLYFFAPDHYEYLGERAKLLLGLPIRPEFIPWILQPTLAQAIIADLFFINMFWGLMNLLPILPLDGGQISRDLLDWFFPANGKRLALGISMILAGLIAVQALSVTLKHPLIPFLWWLGGRFTALLFGLLAFENFMQLQQLDKRPWREDWPSDLDRDREDWRR